MEALKRGYELVSKADVASRDWASANRTGVQEEIEKANLRLYEFKYHILGKS